LYVGDDEHVVMKNLHEPDSPDSILHGSGHCPESHTGFGIERSRAAVGGDSVFHPV
jgi:hypothetical protein